MPDYVKKINGSIITGGQCGRPFFFGGSNMSENTEKNPSVTELGDPRKPHGSAGAEMLRGMNEHHYAVTGWALGFLDLKGESRVLDIGCGGGETLRRMAERIIDGHLTGVDYSPLSVEMSASLNRADVDSGKMDIIFASVSQLPFEDNSFDRIITVESFYFWPEPEKDLREVLRVLDKDGIFLITADIHGDAELSSEDKENIEKYGLFNPTTDEFRELLETAGFRDVTIHTKEGTSWVCAEGRK